MKLEAPNRLDDVIILILVHDLPVDVLIVSLNSAYFHLVKSGLFGAATGAGADACTGCTSALM